MKLGLEEAAGLQAALAALGATEVLHLLDLEAGDVDAMGLKKLEKKRLERGLDALRRHHRS